MEMGKLTAKLRDAVPVCFLVEGKEIKRYKNIEIPDELKKLEYQDFKFDVPLSGAITFKIKFEPGVLPEVFPQERERRTRKPMLQGAEPQETAADVTVEAETQDEQPEGLPASVAEAFAQALEDAQAADEPKAAIAAAVADDEAIKAEIVEHEGEGRLVVITVGPEETVLSEATETTAEAEAQPEIDVPARKQALKCKGKKSAAATGDSDKKSADSHIARP